jgi:hypothetical protein
MPCPNCRTQKTHGDVKQPTLGIDYCRIKDPEVMVGSFHYISFRDSYTNPKRGGEVRTTHPNDHQSTCWWLALLFSTLLLKSQFRWRSPNFSWLVHVQSRIKQMLRKHVGLVSHPSYPSHRNPRILDAREAPTAPTGSCSGSEGQATCYRIQIQYGWATAKLCRTNIRYTWGVPLGWKWIGNNHFHKKGIRLDKIIWLGHNVIMPTPD